MNRKQNEVKWLMIMRSTTETPVLVCHAVPASWLMRGRTQHADLSLQVCGRIPAQDAADHRRQRQHRWAVRCGEQRETNMLMLGSAKERRNEKRFHVFRPAPLSDARGRDQQDIGR